MKIVKKVLVYFFGVFVASALCVWLRPGGLLTAVFYGVFAFALPRLVSKRLDESDAAKPVEYVRELQKRKARESSAEKPDASAAPPPELHYHACPECGQLTPYLQTRCDCGYVFSSRPPVDRRAVKALSVVCVLLLIVCYGLYDSKIDAEENARSNSSAMYEDGYNEGYNVGYSDGESIGIDKGAESADSTYYNDGYKDGYAAGVSSSLDWSRVSEGSSYLSPGLTDWSASPPVLKQSARWWDSFFSTAEIINPYTHKRIGSMLDFEEYALQFMADYSQRR